MAVITISRQLGSGGTEIGRIVAERLGYQIVGSEVINQAAKLSGNPEIALAVIDELNLLGMTPAPLERQAYIAALQGVMRELAEKGNVVIVGRGGQVALRGYRDSFHCRIISPLNIRVERVAKKNQISNDAALAQILASDKNRKRFLRDYYDQQLDNIELYDLIINTETISLDKASEIIIKSVIN